MEHWAKINLSFERTSYRTVPIATWQIILRVSHIL